MRRQRSFFLACVSAAAMGFIISCRAPAAISKFYRSASAGILVEVLFAAGTFRDDEQPVAHRAEVG